MREPASTISDDDAVCDIMHARHVYKLRYGKTIPVSELLCGQEYVITDEMKTLNDVHWQLSIE